MPDNKKYFQNEINKKLKDNEVVESLYKLLENGNKKYLKCINNLFNINCCFSFIICLTFNILGVVSSLIYCKKNKNNNLHQYNKNAKTNDNKKKKIIPI